MQKLLYFVAIVTLTSGVSDSLAQPVADYEYWKDRTVLIEISVYNGNDFVPASKSTGMVIDSSGAILTVRHAIGQTWKRYLDDEALWGSIKFTGRIGGATEPARQLTILRIHPQDDAMMLKISDATDGETFPFFEIGRPASLPPEPVNIAGFTATDPILQRSNPVNLRRPCVPRQGNYCDLGLKLDSGFSGSPVIWNDGRTAVGMVVTSSTLDKSKFLPIRLISSWIADVSKPLYLDDLSLLSGIDTDIVSPVDRARKNFRDGRDLFDRADVVGDLAAGPLLSQAIGLFEEAEKVFIDTGDNPAELLAAQHSLASASERLAYRGHESISFYWLDGSRLQTTSVVPKPGLIITKWPGHYQGGKFQCTEIVAPGLWQDARRKFKDVYAGLKQNFRPSPTASLDRAIQARNVAYFFICDCLRKKNNELDLAIDSLDYGEQVSSVRNLGLRELHEDIVDKIEFAEALQLAGCSNSESTFLRVDEIPPSKPSRAVNVDQKDQSPNGSLPKRQATNIETIVLHLTRRSMSDRLEHPSTKGRSGHYLVDWEGGLHQLVDDDRIAVHSVDNDNNSIGIELEVHPHDSIARSSADRLEWDSLSVSQSISLYRLLKNLANEYPNLKNLMISDEISSQLAAATYDSPKDTGFGIYPLVAIPIEDFQAKWNRIVN